MKLRSWKERWDPNAEFVFAKRLRLGIDPENPFVLPGDPVPKDLSLSRLRRWWEARVIRLADPGVHPRPESMARLRRLTNSVWELRRPGMQPLRLSSRAEGERLLAESEGEPTLVQLNGQMWELQVPGQEPVKIRGKKKAQAALEALA